MTSHSVSIKYEHQSLSFLNKNKQLLSVAMTDSVFHIVYAMSQSNIDGVMMTARSTIQCDFYASLALLMKNDVFEKKNTTKRFDPNHSRGSCRDPRTDNMLFSLFYVHINMKETKKDYKNAIIHVFIDTAFIKFYLVIYRSMLRTKLFYHLNIKNVWFEKQRC